ncbi:MAG: hypothetical protein WCR06_10420 [bacterium]
MKRMEYRDATGTLLAYKMPAEPEPGLTPYSDDTDFIQALHWRYDSGKRLQAHEHLCVPRAATHTQEVIVVLRGRVRTTVYDDAHTPVAVVEVAAGEAMALLRHGHGYEILEDDTRVLEIKNGPYPGAEADRVRF